MEADYAHDRSSLATGRGIPLRRRCVAAYHDSQRADFSPKWRHEIVLYGREPATGICRHQRLHRIENLPSRARPLVNVMRAEDRIDSAPWFKDRSSRSPAAPAPPGRTGESDRVVVARVADVGDATRDSTAHHVLARGSGKRFRCVNTLSWDSKIDCNSQKEHESRTGYSELQHCNLLMVEEDQIKRGRENTAAGSRWQVPHERWSHCLAPHYCQSPTRSTRIPAQTGPKTRHSGHRFTITGDQSNL
jgi:hypothetical protein